LYAALAPGSKFGAASTSALLYSKLKKRGKIPKNKEACSHFFLN
jgi:hypothetical protein